jgi:PKD repeat protein
VNKRQLVSLAMSCCLCLIIMAAAHALTEPGPVHAQASTLHVAPGGNCGGATLCYPTIQDAVDAANPGDTIKVAEGAYVGVQGRPAPAGYNGPYIITQAVYISKTVTIRGGFTTPDYAEPPDPDNHPTTLDANGQGRVLLIAGEISPTIEGLCLTGGDATGLEGWGMAWDAGGGAYVLTATATIAGNEVFGNSARGGGGFYLANSNASLNSNRVTTNTASWSGGGIFLAYGNPRLNGNKVAANEAGEFDGGGLVVAHTEALLVDNTVISNTANNGGGLYLSYSNAMLMGNRVQGNTTVDGGGGLVLYASPATLDGNLIRGNTAGGYWGSGGGGLFLRDSTPTLVNNIIADNHAEVSGGGLLIEASVPHLLHNTIVANTGGDGSGIYITDEGSIFSSATFTNTILVKHELGIHVAGGNSAALDATLWGTSDWSNDQDWYVEPGGSLSTVRDTRLLPDFADPDSGDYHIGLTSGAIDAGVTTTVQWDMDREPRPMRGGYDLGADELPSPPQASFTAWPTSGIAPLAVEFTDTSTGYYSVMLWDFGDTDTSDQDNPAHVYEVPGTYTVSLSVSGAGGDDVETKAGYIAAWHGQYLPLVLRAQ